MKNKNLFWGFLFLLLAMFVIASQTGAFKGTEINPLTIAATILLGAVMVTSLLNRNFFGVFFPLAFLYKLYEGPLKLAAEGNEVNLWVLLPAAFLASLGFHILFRVQPKNIVIPWHVHGHQGWPGREGGEGKAFTQTTETIDENEPYAKVSFGSSSKYLHGDCIKKGYFSSSFGYLEVYFDQAKLSPEGADIFVECSFGAIKLYVPRDWRVIDSVNPVLGGVTNDRRFNRLDDSAPRINLTGNVQFGGIEIQYI